MSNKNPKTDHLVETQFQPGESGNPDGKPKGTLNHKTVIRQIFEDLPEPEIIEFIKSQGAKKAKSYLECFYKERAFRALENNDIKELNQLKEDAYGKNKEQMDLNLSSDTETREKLDSLFAEIKGKKDQDN